MEDGVDGPEQADAPLADPQLGGIPPIEAPATLRHLLRERSFAAYFVGNLISNTGNWFKDIAAAIFVFELTGSATMVAGVAVTGYATSLVLAPVGGAMADRFDRKTLLAVAHLVQALAAVALTIGVVLGTRNPWFVLAMTAVIGFGKAVVTPTLHAVLPSVVARKDLAPALTLQSVTFNGTRAVGPLLGALVTTTLGPAYAFGINAAAYLGFIALLPFIRIAPLPVSSTAATGHRLRNAVRFALRERRIVLMLVGMAVVGMGTDPVITLGPSYAELFGLDPSYAGVLVAAFGVGTLLIVPFVSKMRGKLGPVRSGQSGLLLLGAGLAVLAAAPSPDLAVLGAAIAGAGFLAAGTDFTTTMQELLPDDVRGRVMALWTMAYLGSRPAAAVTSGVVADRFNVRLGVGVIAVLAFGTAIVIGRYRRPLEWNRIIGT